MADQDSTAFDPYYKWLGIPPESQPADHYRLLGLRLFEEDRDVIASAADRQMLHVKSFAAGKYSHHSQALLGELARAKLCLLNAARKAAYDAKLLEKIAPFEEIALLTANSRPAEASQSVPASKPREEQIVPAAATPSQPDEVSINFDSLNEFGTRRKKRPQNSAVLILCLLTVGLAILGYVILQLNYRNNLPKIELQERAPIPKIEPAFVSALPALNGDGFLAELSYLA